MLTVFTLFLRIHVFNSHIMCLPLFNIVHRVNVKHDIVVTIINNNPTEDYNKVFDTVNNAVQTVKECSPTDPGTFSLLHY